MTTDDKVRGPERSGVGVFGQQLGRAVRQRVRGARDAAGETAEITISTEVIAPHPERFGANINVPDYAPWAPNALLLNNWVADGGMEPLILRYKGTATGGTATTIENDAGETTSAGETIGDGFFKGADVRVYRVVEGRVALVRTGTVARYLASPMSGYRIVLDGEGPVVQEGDTYFLSLIRDDTPGASLHPRRAALAGADIWRLIPGVEAGRGIIAQRDRKAVAPALGSRTSLRIENAMRGEGGISQSVAGEATEGNLHAFDPRRTYRIEVWLRQEGVADGAVEVRLGPYQRPIQRTFAVTGEWARYTLTFQGPTKLEGTGMAQLSITFRGPGTLWVDDVRLYETRQAPYAVRPEVVQALKDYHPGTLRIWSGQTNVAWGTTLDNWLAPNGQGMRLWHPDQGPVRGALFSLPTALAFARATGAIPWLIVHLSFDEAEWQNLMEYLGGTPESPYGARRAASGQVRPWTDEFSRILIEYGNETWNHNYAPWMFTNGTHYGQFAEYFFSRAKESVCYAAIAERVEFMIGGYTRSLTPRTYGTSARQCSPSSTRVCMSCYLAGWDPDQTRAHTTEEKFQNTLVYAPWAMHYLVDQQAGLTALLAKMGFPTALATSEAGAHYDLPRPDRPIDQELEMIGASLATGVGLLDMLLYNTAKGFGPQAYYLLGVGPRWASHTGQANDYRPHPCWLALQLRNRYAEGEMISATVTGAPRVDLPEIRDVRLGLQKVALPLTRDAIFSDATAHHPWRDGVCTVPARPGIALLAAYAFRQGHRFAIFVLSRRLSHTTPVTLHLPARPVAATLYTLAGDPRTTNLRRLRVALRRRSLRRFRQDYTFRMPPGSIYLFVVDTD